MRLTSEEEAAGPELRSEPSVRKLAGPRMLFVVVARETTRCDGSTLSWEHLGFFLFSFS